MTEAKILDCTLRDGGYYTAWDFDDATVNAYLSAASELDIDAVELGYINLPRAGYFGRYYFLSAADTANARLALRESQRVAVMFDEKLVRPADVRRLLTDHIGSVDLVRISVAPTRLAEAAALGSEIRSLGFDLAINIMYLSKYSHEVAALQGLDDALAVASTLALVDSYGGCTPHEVARATAELRALAPSTTLGFHGHDNLGLAFANSLAAVESGAAVIDGTMTGMGRGPGNTRSELLLVHKTAADPTAIDLNALERAVAPFESMKAAYGWGTNLAYMVSGASGLPQNDVMDWLGKNRYSTSAIIQALHGDKDANVDRRVFEPLRPSTGESADVVIIGGGSSVADHAEAIARLCTTANLTVIHANYRHLAHIPEFGETQYVCLAGDGAARLPEQATLARASAFIVPSGPRFKGSTPTTDVIETLQVVPYGQGDAPVQIGPVPDTGPLALALGAALALNCRRVTLVGFDGYEHATSAQQALANEVGEIIQSFVQQHPGIELTSATRTRYDIPTYSLYSRLAALGIG